MTTQDRWILYENGEFRQTIAIKLLDWAGYWMSAGIDSIENDLLRRQSERAIHMIIEDLSYCVKIVTSIVISDSELAATPPEEVTDEQVKRIVDGVMANKIRWLTDIAE